MRPFFMHELLRRLLAKREIKIENLDQEEKKTFEGWQAVLSKEELTIEDIKNFCQSQVVLIESKWADYGLEQSKKAELISYYHVYRTLLKVVDSPKQMRENLEKNLLQLLEQK